MEIPGISEEAEVLFWYELRLKQYPRDLLPQIVFENYKNYRS